MKIWEFVKCTFLICSLTSGLSGQVVNDDCFSAIAIDNVTSFCSSGFTNERAQPSDVIAPLCWASGDEENDVWYTFRPLRPGLLFRFFGSGQNSTQTLDNVGFALYEGRCSALTEVTCTRRDIGLDDIFERVYTNLTIGRTYYIRISSASGSAGSFQICLDDFIPVPDPEQDCATAVVLCDKNSFSIEKLQGFGQVRDEAAGSCLDGIRPDSPPGTFPDETETGSAWYKWTARTSGTLTFTLTPNGEDPEEDLDFAIYRLPGGLDDCANKELLICMASGANGPGSPISDAPCKGPTGLAVGDTDILELAGCDIGDNNFAAPLMMVAGESYALIVNNFSGTGFGFSIDFGGTGELLGPEPDFQFTATDNFECDKTIVFENLSTSQTDSITDYRWTFGDGAIPDIEMGEGPHDVIYSSFGSKIAVLTVESSRGCLVTKVLDLEVEPCCDDNSTLMLVPEVDDLTCFESNDGRITALAENGSPEYLFSLDGGAFSPNEIFANLAVGTYNLSVIDIKGCEVSREVQINQPEEIQLFLSSLMDSVRLGEGTQIISQFEPLDRIMMYEWSPPDGLDCIDCPDPFVIPPGSTTYTLSVMDQDGCMQSAEITIFTDDFKPFDAPNVISLSPSNPENGIFKVSGDISLDRIESLRVLDRWGGELYRFENFNPSDPGYIGWDGRVLRSGQKVNPGVYVWVAEVVFIDREVRTFAGTITVID